MKDLYHSSLNQRLITLKHQKEFEHLQFELSRSQLKEFYKAIHAKIEEMERNA